MIDAIQLVIGGGEGIGETVLIDGGGDELLDTDLDDLERGLGVADPRPSASLMSTS